MTTDSASTPLLNLHQGRATISLNRPAHHNRLHVQDLLVLQQHFAALTADATVKLLVLTGLGRSFCSGFHIGEFDAPASPNEVASRTFQAMPEKASAAAIQARASARPHLFEQTVDLLEALPMPSICRLNGSVYGGATDLALACDFRIGVAGMELRMPAARLGLHYYPSGLQRYVTRLGLRHAKRLFLLAQSVPDHELMAMGYLDHLAAADQLDSAVQAMADALAAGAPLALRGMKTSLNELARGDANLAELRAREALCAQSLDLREGKAAFAEKRMPRFIGR